MGAMNVELKAAAVACLWLLYGILWGGELGMNISEGSRCCLSPAVKWEL